MVKASVQMLGPTEGTRVDREQTHRQGGEGGRAPWWAGGTSLGIHYSGAKQLVRNKNKHQGIQVPAVNSFKPPEENSK